jgi:hypothetical protein
LRFIFKARGERAWAGGANRVGITGEPVCEERSRKSVCLRIRGLVEQLAYPLSCIIFFSVFACQAVTEHRAWKLGF